MRRVTGLPDDQVVAWESKLEAQVVASLQLVMDKIAGRIERIQVASAMPRVLVAVATTGPSGDDDPPPMTGELAIPEPVPLPEAIPETPGLPPGQPFVSPDDLASIAPLWQQQVVDQILPLAAQVFLDSAGHVRAQMLDAVAPSVLVSLPGLGSVSAEAYLAQARNTFEQVGDHLWATARAQLSEGFEAGESIPQLGARLRQSAGLSARTGVMVTRTQVIEASNAGSIATARASQLTMQKEWIATPDLRTRPTHLAADGQRVDLNEPFLVGGHSADFPAAPSLPPSERYGCRCTQGYVMPDRAATEPAGQPALPPAQQLAELPGTSRPAIEGRPEPEEGPLTLFYPKRSGELSDTAGPIDLPEPTTKVRSSLLKAHTPAELTATWQAQMRAITGRDIIVQLPPDVSVLTMREHAEGVLQMLERFPEARLRKISWFDGAQSANYAQVRRGSATIEFNSRIASIDGRRAYLASLRSDIAGWDDAAGPGIGWSVRGARFPQATSFHEFGHILSIETMPGAKLESRALSLLQRRAAAEGIDADTLAARDISAYAGTDGEELIGEAMTDVMVNGSRASAISREIYDLVAGEYRARGLGVRTTDVVDDLIDDLGIEGFGGVDVFPKAPAPRMPRPVVARGKDLTGDHELAVRTEKQADRERALPKDAAGRAQLPEGYQGDYAFHELAKAQGFDGLPRIVADDGQWQRLLDAEYVPLFRGHGWAGGDGAGQVDAFNYGERYVGGGFAPGNNMSTRYETALHYADGHDSAVGHYALPTDAKIINYPDLVAERNAYVARLPSGPAGDAKRSLYLTGDENLGLGRFGVARGYDAMVVPRGETLLTDRVEEWVIFNRSKLVAYDDSAKGVAAAGTGKVTPARMTPGERARREKDAVIVSARQVGHLTRELDQMISEAGEEAFRSGALFRRIQAKGSELGTPPSVMREFIAAARPSEKGSSLQALRVAMDRANADAGVTRIGSPGQVWRFDGRRDDPTGAVRDIADGSPVVVVRPGSLIQYKGKPLQVAPPRVRVATPEEAAAIDEGAAVSVPPPPSVSAPRLGSMTVGDLRALAKERGITVPAGTRKADLVRMLDEAPPGDVVSVPAPVAPAPGRLATMKVGELRALAKERGIAVPVGTRKADLVRMLDEAPSVAPVGAPPAGEFRASMTRAEADAWAAKSKIPFDLQHGTTPEGAEGITRAGFDLERLGTKTDTGNLGAGFYFNPAGAPSYGEAKGYGATLTVRARVDKVMLTSSRDYARARAVEDYIDILHSGGEGSARRYLDSKVIPSTIEGRFIPSPGTTNGELIGALTDEQVARYLAIRNEGKISGFVLRQRAVDEGYDAIVWDFPGSAIPGFPVRDGATWFEVNVLKASDVTIVTPAVPARVLAARAELERVRALPVLEDKSRRMSGANAITTQVEHEGGPPTITKDFSRLGEGPAASKRRADAEELGSLVSESVGIRAPAVIRTGPRSVEMEYLEGRVGEEGVAFGGDPGPLITGSDDGRLLGLADILMGNTDRNTGNWMQLPTGRLGAIDHESAFGAPKLAGANNPFGAALIKRGSATKATGWQLPDATWPKSIDIAPADLALIRQHLEALKPEFDRLGRATWHKQMMGRLVEVEKRATGTRTRLGEATASDSGAAAGFEARQAVIDERRAVADSLAEARELLANGASERALAHRGGLIEGRARGVAGEDLVGLVRAMRSGDADQIRVAIGDVAQRRGLTAIDDAPAGQDWVAYDPKLHDLVGGEARPPAGTFMHVSRPGYSVRLDDGEVVQLAKARVERLTPEELAAVRGQVAEQSAAAERKAVREAARERNRVIEAQRGTARLLAEVDELAAKGASKTVIRERLDPALREAGQAYAGADSTAVDVVSAALDSGDTAKIRAAVTRAGTKAKIKPIGRAGAKTTFDPDTMEGVGGIDIAPGAKVTVVRRGSSVPGLTDPLTKAQVTPISASPPIPAKARPRLTPQQKVDASIKSRTQQPVGYPERAKIPAGKEAPGTSLPDYDPPSYTAKSVLANDRTVKPGGWADPPRAPGVTGPKNPYTRTGIQGRGLLGRYGENPAGDRFVLSVNPDTGQLEMITIVRGQAVDGRFERAMPGGMVDAGEDAAQAARRELKEETGVDLPVTRNDKAVYQGYVDDPRNTDDAWMETTVYRRVLTPEERRDVRFTAGEQEGEIHESGWVPVDQDTIAHLYAGHPEFARLAIRDILSDKSLPLTAAQRAQLKAAIEPIAAPAKAAVKGAATRGAPRFDLQWEMARGGVSESELEEIRELVRIKRPGIIVGNELDEIISAQMTFISEPRLKAFFDEHRGLYNYLVKEDKDRRTWIDQYAGAATQMQAKATRALRRAVAPGKPIVVRRSTESSLRDILDDGRMKTQFETGTSSGYVDNAIRADFEEMAFGLPKDLPVAQRPVYGYVAPRGLDADRGGKVDQYGDIRIVLRDSVRPRTTVSAGDSLDRRAELTPMPIDGPLDWRAAQPAAAKYADLGDQRFQDLTYVEAQIHGGVKVSDIEEVVFGHQPEPATAAALEKAGVPWRVQGTVPVRARTASALREVFDGCWRCGSDQVTYHQAHECA